MLTSYKRRYRAIYLLSADIVFVTQYRYQVFDNQILNRLQVIFKDTCLSWNTIQGYFEGGANYIHLTIGYPPDTRLSELVANLKTVSSRLIRKEFNEYLTRFYTDSRLWSSSYLVANGGTVTTCQIREFVGTAQVRTH